MALLQSIQVIIYYACVQCKQHFHINPRQGKRDCNVSYCSFKAIMTALTLLIVTHLLNTLQFHIITSAQRFKDHSMSSELISMNDQTHQFTEEKQIQNS
jgi:DNA-directed RNA polymerase subunit RPC12/RpoP